MKKIIAVANLILFLLTPIPFSWAFDNGDFQYWNTESIEVKFAKSWKIKLDEEFRFGGNAGDLYYTHADVGVAYSVNDYLELGANYRQIFQKKDKDWDPTYQPHFNGTLKLNWQGFILKDRNRFEYRIRETDSASWRYRNRLSLDLPYKWTPLKIQPYFSDEIFYDFEASEMNKNRVYVGVKMVFLKNLNGELYYMRESTKTKKWKEVNVLGTTLKVSF